MTEIENLLRSFNIDRSDIKELWSTGRFGTIAVPADRYKQYHDTIAGLQAELAARDMHAGRLVEYLRESESLDAEEIHNLILDLEAIARLK